MPRFRAPPALVLGLALLLSLLTLGTGVLAYMDEAPAAIAFDPVRQAIPGSLVRSHTVPLAGFRGPVVARVGGAAEQLFLNGKPVGTLVRVSPGDRLAVAVRASSLLNDTAIGLVQVGGSITQFRVASIRRPPPARLAFEPVSVARGHIAASTIVAPTGFAPGTVLEVDDPAVQVETSSGKSASPATLAPGEPFRLVARVPKDSPSPLTIKVKLGDLAADWRIAIR